MFQEVISTLESVERFDRIVSTKHVKIGEIETPSGASELALRMPEETRYPDQVILLEDKAKSQLLGQWEIPPAHFNRLPRVLQVAELAHFGSHNPKDLTFRLTQDKRKPQDYPAARAVVSDRYSAFDNSDVLRTIEPYIEGFEAPRVDVKRDEMQIIITRPEVHDVSVRKVGDMVKTGLSIRNSEIGEMALGVNFTLWRLACLNGAQIADTEVSVRQRHIYVDKRTFVIQLKNAIANVMEIGEGMVKQLRAAHDLKLPNLDPDDGKLQREIAKLLTKEGLWTKEFQRNATEVLGTTEEASLFGLVQYLNGAYAKGRPRLADRISAEKVAGRLMSLAA